jgi:hypothetical protein
MKITIDCEGEERGSFLTLDNDGLNNENFVSLHVGGVEESEESDEYLLSVRDLFLAVSCFEKERDRYSKEKR